MQPYRQTEDFDGESAMSTELENIPREIDSGEDFDNIDVNLTDGGADDAEEGKDEDVSSENESVPVFAQVGWKDKVTDFLQRYPIAKQFSAQIGSEIAQNQSLQQDGDCLEKALAAVLATAYISPEKLAGDEEFLQKYIYENNAVKDKIIQEYLDGLQQNLPPKSISSRGRTALTPPSRPKSIAEAGSVIKAMLDNRRI